MDNYSNQITDYLLTQSWQIAVLVVLIATANLSLRNRSAHVRYLLWLIVLAKCLVPPFLTVPLPVLPDERVMIVSPPPESQPILVEPLEASVAETPAPAAAKHTPRMTAHQWLAAGWIMGVGVFILVASVKALQTAFWLSRERKSLPAGLQSEIKELFSGLVVRISPKLWLVEGIGQPFVWGLLRGSIYLPGNFTGADTAEHRRGILGHELSHVLRFDAAVNLLQIAAQGVFWFHPLVWWANKKIRAEREKCCDEMAIARLGAAVKDYSSAIVNILITEHESTRPVPSLAIAGPVKNIEERIRTMLRPGKKFYKRPSLPVATVVVLTALLSVPTTVVLTVRAEDHPTTESVEAGQIFGDPTNLGPTVNSSTGEWGPHISADGLSLYFVRDRPRGSGGEDIWIAERRSKDDPWSLPVNLGSLVNSGEGGGAPSLSPDGFSLYFVRDRPRGSGGEDIWVTKRQTNDDPWGMPVNLGPTVNSAASESGPSICADGLALYFSEQRGGPYRPGGIGDADIWVTTRKSRDDPWGTPVNLGSTVNSSYSESTPDISRDGSTLYFVSNRPGNVGGPDDSDIWQVSLNSPGAKPTKSLHKAAAAGDIEKVRSLISKGADVNASLWNGQTPLHCATHSGSAEVVGFLISKGANVNAKDTWRNRTALHYAAGKGDKQIVELLLEKGADVNAGANYNKTAAELAMWGNHTEIVKLLVAKGADISPLHLAIYLKDEAKTRSLIEGAAYVHKRTPYGTTPLHRALGVGLGNIAKLLIEKGADVNAKDNWDWTPLHSAAESGHKDVVELLIARGADVNAKQGSGKTPLYFAKGQGHAEIVELLRKHGATESLHDVTGEGDIEKVRSLIAGGADVNAKSTDGQTPLDIALSQNRKDIVDLLITNGADVSLHTAAQLGLLDRLKELIGKGADVNAKDARNRTALHYAAGKGHKQIVELLLEKGADVNAGANYNKTAAELAMWGNYTEIVKLLISKGADISPLHLAIYLKDEAKARSLIEGGADVNKRTPYGTTPLDRAVRGGLNDVVELLIAKGADVNAKDNWDWTPLHSAAEGGRKDMVQLLIAKGANVNAKQEDGRTAAFYAQAEGHTEIVELLRKHGARD